MRMLWFFCIANFLACSPKVDTWEGFLEQYAHTKCLVYKECYRALYEGEYENYSTCKEEVMEIHQMEKEEDFSNCSFSAEAAMECLEETNASSCGEHWSDHASIFKSCHEDIWTCSED